LTSTGIATLRSPHLSVTGADVSSDMVSRSGNNGAGRVSVLPTSGDYLGYHGLDLTGVTAIEFDANASGRDNLLGGTIEVRLDGPTGPLLGQAEIVVTTGFGFGGGRGRGQARPADPRATVDPVNEVRDVYFVFTNDEAPGGAPLATVTEMRFLRE
jgi:cytochrome c